MNSLLRKKKNGKKGSTKDKAMSAMAMALPPPADPGQYANMRSFSVMDDALDPVTEMAAWFASGMAREEVKRRAAALLEMGARGEFMVRDKTGAPHCYALTVKDTATDFMTFLIEKSPDSGKPGYMIRGCSAVCTTVAKLIKFYRDEERPELGVQLKNPGPYLMSYVATVYDQTKQAIKPRKASVRTKYSAGSLDNKARHAGDELDDSDEDGNDGAGAGYDLASPDGAGVFDGSGDGDGAAPTYDMASGDPAPTTCMAKRNGSMNQADYELASPDGAAETSIADGAAMYAMASPAGTGSVAAAAAADNGLYDNVGPGGTMARAGTADDIYAVAASEDTTFASPTPVGGDGDGDGDDDGAGFDSDDFGGFDSDGAAD